MVTAITLTRAKRFVECFGDSVRTPKLARKIVVANKVLQRYFPGMAIRISDDFDREQLNTHKDLILVYGQVFIRELATIRSQLSKLNIELPPRPEGRYDEADEVFDLFKAFLIQKIIPVFKDCNIEVKGIRPMKGDSGGNNPCWDFLYP